MSLQYNIQPYLTWNVHTVLKRYYPVFAHHPTEPLWVRQAPNKICILGSTEPCDANLVLHTRLIGTKIHPDTILAETDSEPKRTIRAHMHGTLLELNSRLIDEPHLLSSHCMDEAYLAVIKPTTDDSHKQLALFDISPSPPA